MPLMVRCGELQPGMRLAEPLVWQGRVMLAAGTDLTATDIESLSARFPDRLLRIGDPVLDETIAFEDDGHERQVAHKARRLISDCMSDVQRRFGTHASLDGLSIQGIHEAVREVITFLNANPVSAALLDDFVGGDHYLSARAGNVFYLSMMLGNANREYIAEERQRLTSSRELSTRVSDNLLSLGLGAMLIDLGMLPLSHLFDSNEPLTPETWSQIRLHPVVGAKLLADDFPAAARMIVRTHHENMDGSGYPDGLAGEQLHIFTRIVRVADAFDAATSRAVYREAKSPVRVLWEMTVGPYRQFYDETVVTTLGRLLHPFPIGAKIRLADRRYAVVVKYNRASPIAPHVIVAFDSLNRRLPDNEIGAVFTLGERPELRGVSYAGEDLSYLYGGEDTSHNRSRVGVWPSLFEAAYP